MKISRIPRSLRRIEIARCVVAAICHSAFADEVEVAVTNTPGRMLIAATGSSRTILVAGTTHVDEYPSSVGNPQFWFDCSKTNGWTVVESAGVKTVTKIPSLVA